MIYLFYGNDDIRSRDKYNAVINSLLAKSPEASLFRLNSENFEIAKLRELTLSQGLFYQKFVVACDNLLSGDEILAESVLSQLEAIARSDNIFIFLENKAKGETLEKLKEASVKAQEFSSIATNGKLSFNIFSFTDAFSARNRSRAWTLYHEALAEGFSSEELFWKLIWATNNMILVKKTKEEKKIKMNPYPLTKTKVAVQKFSVAELENLSASFVSLYHEDYLGTDEFEFKLEKIILSV